MTRDDDDAHAHTVASDPSLDQTMASPVVDPSVGDTVASPSSSISYPSRPSGPSSTHFVPERELARGGMGRVVIAKDRRLDRTVALKLLQRDSPMLRARFEREATITAQLAHPAIVPIYETGELADGEPFYASSASTASRTRSRPRPTAACSRPPTAQPA